MHVPDPQHCWDTGRCPCPSVRIPPAALLGQPRSLPPSPASQPRSQPLASPQDPVCPAGSVPFPYWGSGTSPIAQGPVLILICWELASVMGACKSSSGTDSPRLPPHWSPLAVSSPGCIVISCDEAFQKMKQNKNRHLEGLLFCFFTAPPQFDSCEHTCRVDLLTLPPKHVLVPETLLF